jgi:hypothetical protein
MSSMPNQPVFKLEGGAKLHQAIADWSKQSSTLFTTLFIGILVLFASFSDQLPRGARWQLSSFVGRLLLLTLLFIIYELGGWIPALLFSIGIVMIWSNRPLTPPSSFGVGAKTPIKTVKEGFQSSQKHSKVQGSRWFVEKILQEHPEEIEEDRVSTQSVQDDTYSPNSRTSR